MFVCSFTSSFTLPPFLYFLPIHILSFFFTFIQRVFHSSDVPEHVRKAKREIRESVLGPVLGVTQPRFSASTADMGLTVSYKQGCPWDDASARRDNRYYKVLDNKARVEREKHERLAEAKALRELSLNADKLRESVLSAWNGSTTINRSDVSLAKIFPPPPRSPANTCASAQHDMTTTSRSSNHHLNQQQQQCGSSTRRSIPHLPETYESLLERHKHAMEEIRARKLAARSERSSQFFDHQAKEIVERDLAWNLYPPDVAVMLSQAQFKYGGTTGNAHSSSSSSSSTNSATIRPVVSSGDASLPLSAVPHRSDAAARDTAINKFASQYTPQRLMEYLEAQESVSTSSTGAARAASGASDDRQSSLSNNRMGPRPFRHVSMSPSSSMYRPPSSVLADAYGPFYTTSTSSSSSASSSSTSKSATLRTVSTAAHAKSLSQLLQPQLERLSQLGLPPLDPTPLSAMHAAHSLPSPPAAPTATSSNAGHNNPYYQNQQQQQQQHDQTNGGTSSGYPYYNAGTGGITASRLPFGAHNGMAGHGVATAAESGLDLLVDSCVKGTNSTSTVSGAYQRTRSQRQQPTAGMSSSSSSASPRGKKGGGRRALSASSFSSSGGGRRRESSGLLGGVHAPKQLPPPEPLYRQIDTFAFDNDAANNSDEEQ